MGKRVLIIAALVVSFALAANVYAANQDGNNGMGISGRSQNQVVNQSGSDESEQAQANTTVQSDLAEEDDASAQVQNQNEIEDQDEEGQVQNSGAKNGEEEDRGTSAIALARRSQVANAVQEMLAVADRDGGIGQEVREIAQAQNQNHEELEASLEKVESRSGFARFFLGPDYQEIRKAEKALAQSRERLEQLNQASEELAEPADRQDLAGQVQVLAQANEAIESSLAVSQKGFSLLGWLFKMFAK